MASLRAVVIMAYRNVHLAGHGIFAVSKDRRVRNRAPKPGMDHASLSRVLVHRGQPSPEHDPKPYARNQARKAQWERDTHVRVHLRPLKYRYEYDDFGRAMVDADGKRLVTEKDEKVLTYCVL
jgi:hypothetical protein